MLVILLRIEESRCDSLCARYRSSIALPLACDRGSYHWGYWELLVHQLIVVKFPWLLIDKTLLLLLLTEDVTWGVELYLRRGEWAIDACAMGKIWSQLATSSPIVVIQRCCLKLLLELITFTNDSWLLFVWYSLAATRCIVVFPLKVTSLALLPISVDITDNSSLASWSCFFNRSRRLLNMMLLLLDLDLNQWVRMIFIEVRRA